MFMKRLIDFLPPAVVRWLARVQYDLPILQPVIQQLAHRFRNQDHTIRHGVGKGLRFNPRGGNPGYALGTSGIEEQRALQAFLSEGAAFYNIGANKGFYAVLGAQLVGPEGTVYAVEPFPDSAEAIRYNAALNGFSQIEVLELAVSDRQEKGEFLLTGDSVEFKLASSRTAPANHDATTLDVDVWSLDALIRERGFDPPTFVMIDVEGSEIEVLNGMRETIRTHRPVVLCEIHWLKQEVKALVEDFFEPNCYSVSQLNGDALPSSPERYHALFVPNECAQT